VDQRPPETSRARQREEGIHICGEIVQQVREIEGVHGVHLMAYRQEESVAEIIERAGLLPGDDLRAGICAPGEL
jgi:methylenetetrahydrofolate reductase (NADPH)